MSSAQRRSGRISRRVPILLLGTDTSGRVFSEATTTLVLSRHGAGILSRYRLAPDEALTLRLPGSSAEAEVRLVGHLGEQNGAHAYGLAFVDPELDFWKVEFPPPQGAPFRPGFTVDCELCKTRQTIEQSEIEEDVFAVSDSLLRYCEHCGCSTSWRRAAPARKLEPALPAAVSVTASKPVPEPELVAAGAAEVRSAPALEAPVPIPCATPVEATGRRANRRRHVRTKVSFTACVRYCATDDIVECDNVSRGGLCFRSRKQYPQDEAIEIAAPYSMGDQAIFVSAEIRRIEELPSGLFRYGAEYTKSTQLPAYR